jgi:hypothetical protein
MCLIGTISRKVALVRGHMWVMELWEKIEPVMKNVACSSKGLFSCPAFSVVPCPYYLSWVLMTASLQCTHINPESRGRTLLWNIGICLPTQLLVSQSEHSVPQMPRNLLVCKFYLKLCCSQVYQIKSLLYLIMFLGCPNFCKLFYLTSVLTAWTTDWINKSPSNQPTSTLHLYLCNFVYTIDIYIVTILMIVDVVWSV